MLKAAGSNIGRLARVFKHSSPALLFSDRFLLAVGDSSHLSDSPCLPSGANIDFTFTRWSLMPRASFSSEAGAETKVQTTETVKEFYDKILKSVNVQRTAPPNAWLWSLIGNCANVEDIELLFDVLQNLRRFRLSHLRIHENYNENLCREVTKACVRVGAIDFGKKALWKHNVYGLTPSIGSAHHLLRFAKQNNDANLMVEVMKLLKKNAVQLQAGTADLVFSICYNTGKSDLISKYSKRFIREGVKLRETPSDAWMEFSAQREKVKELKLDMLCHPNTVLRSTDGYSEVSFKELFGKRIMLVLEKFDPKNGFREDPEYKKFALMLKGRYSQTAGTDDEFEVIRIILDDTESDTGEQLDLGYPECLLLFERKHADMGWFVMLASKLKINLNSSHYWYDKSPSDFQSYFQILAFDGNGRLVRKTMYPTFEDMEFPFYAGSLEEETLAQLSTAVLKY